MKDQNEHTAFTDHSRSKVIDNVKTADDVALVGILMLFHARDHVLGSTPFVESESK